MLELLEIKKSEGEITLKNYKKYKERIESEGFKGLEYAEQVGEEVKELSEYKLNIIITFLKLENNSTRISLQELIDERTLKLNEHIETEETELIILNLDNSKDMINLVLNICKSYCVYNI